MSENQPEMAQIEEQKETYVRCPNPYCLKFKNELKRRIRLHNELKENCIQKIKQRDKKIKQLRERIRKKEWQLSQSQSIHDEISNSLKDL